MLKDAIARLTREKAAEAHQSRELRDRLYELAALARPSNLSHGAEEWVRMRNEKETKR